MLLFYSLQIEVEDLTGIRIGIVKEGFGLEKSEEAVDRIVRESAQQLTSVGAKVEDVSIPLHSLCKRKAMNTRGNKTDLDISVERAEFLRY